MADDKNMGLKIAIAANIITIISVIGGGAYLIGGTSKDITNIKETIIRIENERDLQENVLKAKKSINDFAKDKLHLIPVGAVVPFFLTTEEISRMAPVWLPANGEKCFDEKSPFYKKPLPDLQNRFPLGSDHRQNVLPKDGNEGGSLSVKVDLKTGGASYFARYTNQSVGKGKGEFVIDTNKDELKGAKHNHSISDTISLPMPPYGRLIYLVRVR